LNNDSPRNVKRVDRPEQIVYEEIPIERFQLRGHPRIIPEA